MRKSLLILTLAGLANTALAQNWYLAPNGVDSANCTAKETPCKNIHPLVARAEFSAGDTILMRSGTYDLGSTTNGWGGTLNKAFTLQGGYDVEYKTREKLASKTIITDSRTTGNQRLFAFETGHQIPVVIDGVQISDFNQESGATDSGIIVVYAAGAWLKLNDVIITNNTLSGAPAIDLGTSDSLLEITNSSITHNTARTNYSALRLRGGTRTIIKDTIIADNSASGSGGAIYAYAGAVLDMSNVTLYGNTAASNAGAIYADNSQISCTHCSIVANASTSGAQAINLANGAKLKLKNSVIANEGSGVLISGAANSVIDQGYNALGLNNTLNLSGGVVLPNNALSYKNIEANLSDIFATDIAQNGGLIESLKLSSNSSSLIDKIPNDMPALQTGDSPSKPFASLADAHNALAGYAHYDQKRYFFNINGKAFSTVVDKDGWVLVAAGTRLQSTGAYTEVTTLEEASDNILHRSILTDAGFVFDEVRITSRNLSPAPIDVRSGNQNVITALKNFKMLPNNFVDVSNYGNGGWYAEQGAQYVLNDTPSGSVLTGLPNSGTAADLNQVIYEATGKTSSGIFWAPAGADGHVETYQSTTGPRIVDFDLWVRSSASACGGVVNTDQRGLPRPDYVNPNDPAQYGEVHDCDIGSFEWNNGYRIDCWDEDGERPENSITSSQTSFCIGDPRLLTPKAIMDNLGAISWQYLLLLSSLLFWRFKNNKNKAGTKS